MLRKLLVAGAVSVLTLQGCSPTNEEVFPPEPFVTLAMTRLPPLGAGEGRYELWITYFNFNKTHGETRVLHSTVDSIAAFNVAPDSSTIVDQQGAPLTITLPEGRNAQLLDEAFVVIRRDDDFAPPADDDVPPGSIVMAGRFTGSTSVAIADMVPEYTNALGVDLSACIGRYRITSPTSPPDSLSGIWYFRTEPVPGPSLTNMPRPASGWIYQGWVVHQNGTSLDYYSTGRFARVDTADSDGPGFGAGPLPGLNYPGQDFITGPLILPNLTSFAFSFLVTLEPEPDNADDAPYIVILTSIGPQPDQPLRDGELFNKFAAHRPVATLRVVR